MPIEKSTMGGYTKEMKPFTSTLNTVNGGASVKDMDASGNLTRTEELKGFNHTFSPALTKTTLGYYDKPRVEFDNGVNIVGYTVIGGVVGILLGAVAGGVAGGIIEKTRLIQEAKEAANNSPKPSKPKPPKQEPQKT